MTEMLQQDETKPFTQMVSSSTEGTSSDEALSSSVWSLLPEANKLGDSSSSLMPALPAIDRSTITDVAAVYGQTPYYGAGYPTTAYGMYAGSSPAASYYQQMAASSLATPNTSARFPYNITNPAATAYYAAAASSFDYSAYNNSPYYNQMRQGYYSNLAAGTAAYQSSAVLPDSSTDLTSFSLKSEVKKGKSAKKKKGPCSPNDNNYARVFVWDLSDVSVIGMAIQKAAFAQHSIIILKHLLQNVTALAIPPEQLDECEMCNVEDAAIEEQEQPPADGSVADRCGSGAEIMRRISAKYLALKQLYQEYACKLDALIDRVGTPKRCEVDEALRQLRIMLGNGSESAQRCLEIVVHRSQLCTEKYANVIISADGLPTGAAQVLTSGLAPYVPIDNIYSVAKTNKEQVLERIVTRFGKKCSYVMITGHHELAHAGKKESMAVWPVNCPEDFDKLFTAQTNYLLGRPSL